MKHIWKVIAVVALVVALAAWFVPVGEEAVPRSYQTKVHSDGPHKLVVESGGEIEVLSGATLDIQSGATTDFSSGIDLDGASLVMDADGDSAFVEASDDLITFTPGAATGSLEVRTGNLQVGNGSPGETHDGEDLYVEGISEFDGSSYFDGAVDMDSTLDVAGTATFSKASGTALDVDSGGELNVDGTLDVNGTSDFGAAVTCSYAGNCLTSGATADIEWLGFASFGDGTPNGVTDGTAEALYVEGGLEVDGTIYADGAADFDSTLDVDGLTDLDDVDIDLSAALNIDGHMLDVGTGSYTLADADDDVGIAGDLEVDDDVQVDGNLAALWYVSTKQVAIDLGVGFTITPTGTYQPVTVNYTGTVTSDGTTSIANGSTSGQVLIVINEDDQDVVLTDGTNILAGGNITLTANTDDSVVFLWDGADWVVLAFHDN